LTSFLVDHVYHKTGQIFHNFCLSHGADVDDTSKIGHGLDLSQDLICGPVTAVLEGLAKLLDRCIDVVMQRINVCSQLLLQGHGVLVARMWRGRGVPTMAGHSIELVLILGDLVVIDSLLLSSSGLVRQSRRKRRRRAWGHEKLVINLLFTSFPFVTGRGHDQRMAYLRSLLLFGQRGCCHL
jgi:hypothetical protein